LGKNSVGCAGDDLDPHRQWSPPC